MTIWRGRYDAEIYTNDADKLGEKLSREVSKRAAFEVETSSSDRRGRGYAGEESRAEVISQTAQAEGELSRKHGIER